MKSAIFCIVAVLGACLLLVACDRPAAGPVAIITPTAEPTAPAAPTEPVVEGHIAVLLPASAPAEWDSYFTDAFTAAAAQFAIITASDAATLAAAAAAELAQGAKVIVLGPVADDAATAVIAAARDAGIEVIGFHHLTATSPDLYVGYDDRLAGRLLAEGLAPLIDAAAARPHIVVLNGPAGDPAATLLRAGLDETLAPRLAAGEWQVAGDFAIEGWDEAQAASRLATLLDSGSSFDAIITTDDRLAGGAASVMTARELPAVPLSGRGATVEAVRRLLNGQQAFTLYTPALLEANATAAAAVDLLRGDEIPSLTDDVITVGQEAVPYIRLRPLRVTAEDIDAILVADDYLTWDEICAEGVVGPCPVGQ